MGYYLETSANHGKADAILKNIDGAREVTCEAARDTDKDANGVVVVMENGPFDAAGFAFSESEFQVFAGDPSDPRPKRFIIISRKQAEELSGYPPTEGAPGNATQSEEPKDDE